MVDGYTLLQIAIVRRAIGDYILALKKNNPAEKSKLERFFLSEWGQSLSGNRGEVIIERCKKQAKGEAKYWAVQIAKL